MKYLLLTFSFCFVFLISNAQSVSRDEALRTGTNLFMHYAKSFNLEKNAIEVENETLLKSKSGMDCIYAFSLRGGGFILVSADKRVVPVLAYSFDDNFDANNLAPATQLWLDKYMEQFELIDANDIPATDNIKNAWKEYSEGISAEKESAVGVETLLTTRWNQDSPYNYYCPYHPAGPGERVYAGCVATAMAQVMKYWNYPETGRGTHDYFWGDYFTVDFENTTYQWDSMKNFITTTASRHSIAELIFHCAISVDMNFSHTGSSSSITSAFFALKQNFRYRAGVYELDKSDVEDFEWKLTLKEDLDKAHPILYRGTDDGGNGHAFVCDGYQDTSYFHFNWGWGGWNNGFFYLDDINPQMDFYWGQGALINLTPNDAVYCSSMVYDQPTWSFNDGSGPNYYFNNTNCNWLISLTEHEYDFIRMYFTKYDMLEGDTLKIYEGNSSAGLLIGTYTAANAPSEMISYADEIYLEFVTNSQGQADGWELTYETVALGVESNNKESHISIFPNPANDFVTIFGLNEASDINIIDMSGRVLYSTGNFNNGNLDISAFASGVYFITIENQDIKTTRKLIKN